MLARSVLLVLSTVFLISSMGFVGGAGAVSLHGRVLPAVSPADPTVQVNLLGGTYVSSSLVYNGFANGGNRTFPVLLTGSETHEFWSSTQSVLMLAPSWTPAHSSGMVLFPSPASAEPSLRVVGAAGSSANYSSGDGLEAYLFVTPTYAANWSTPYYATDPEGANGTFVTPQGSVLFPYSETPYIAVQWDPALGHLHSVNLYMVTPGTGGIVSPSSVSVVQVGSGVGSTPASTDYVTLNLTYDVSTNVLVGNVTDQTTGSVVCFFDLPLEVYGFTPSVSWSTQYYFGAGGSGNGADSWGLLYLGLSLYYPLSITAVFPSTIELAAGAVANFGAEAYALNGASLNSEVTVAWSFFPATLGTLNSTSGRVVTFTAGTLRENGTIFANATYRGVTEGGAASISTAGPAPSPSHSSTSSSFPLSPLDLALLAVAIVAIVVAVVVVVLAKRGRGPQGGSLGPNSPPTT